MTSEPRAIVVCRGSWLLGSACGTCERCKDEALEIVRGLIKEKNALQTQLVAIISCIPPGGHGFDYSDEFKVRCFNEARRLILEWNTGRK